MAKIKVVESADGAEQPTVVVLDDGTEINLSDIDGGFMRQSDYTTKTQALSAERQALEQMNASHQTDDVINSTHESNPDAANVTRMYIDMKMDNMKSIYGDSFDEVAVLNKATEQLKMGILPTAINFDDIHKAMSYKTAGSDRDAIKQEILQEMAAQNIDTSSIISSMDGSAIGANDHGLSSQEKSYCDKTGTDYKEYAKWKN